MNEQDSFNSLGIFVSPLCIKWFIHDEIDMTLFKATLRFLWKIATR